MSIPKPVLDAAIAGYLERTAGINPSPPGMVAALEAALALDRSKLPCPKCGSRDVSAQHRAASTGCGERCHEQHDEHFRRYCRGCRYEWVTFDVLTPDPPGGGRP